MKAKDKKGESVIKSTDELEDREFAAELEREDRDGFAQLERDLKDPSKWRKATPEENAEAVAVVASIRAQRKRMGRPPAEKPFKGIHINLPLDLLTKIKEKASRLNIGYQSYIKMALTRHFETAEAVGDEPKAKKPAKKAKRKGTA